MLGKHGTWTGGTIARNADGELYALAVDNYNSYTLWWLTVDTTTGKGTPIKRVRGYSGGQGDAALNTAVDVPLEQERRTA